MREVRQADRADILLMARIEVVDSSTHAEILSAPAIPSVISDPKYLTPITMIQEQCERLMEINPGAPGDWVDMVTRIISTLTAYQRQQENMLRHLVIESRKLRPQILNLSQTGIRATIAEAEVCSKLHCYILFPDMMIPFSLAATVVRACPEVGEGVFAAQFCHRSNEEKIAMSHYLAATIEAAPPVNLSKF